MVFDPFNMVQRSRLLINLAMSYLFYTQLYMFIYNTHICQ